MSLGLAPFPTGLSLPEGLLLGLRMAYSKPRRYYHNFSHVLEVLGHYRLVDSHVGWQHPKEVYCAALYHDAIYAYGAKDNEKQSAELARNELARWLPHGGLNLDTVARLIVLTASHGTLKRSQVSAEERLFLDCDMAIMASEWPRFQRYEEDIQKEYTQIYSLELFRQGRRVFLENLRKKERIFLSDFFHERLDSLARRNLNKALD